VDERGLEGLIQRHGRDVLAYARRRSDATTAEDVTAEVFVVAWRRSPDIPEGGELPWLYGVARRVLANERRAARRRDGLVSVLRGLRGEAAPPPGFDDSGVLEALGTLKRGDQELLMLTAWEGLTTAEAAVVVGCSTRAAHTRLHRARGRLQTALDRPHRADAPIVEKGITS
jgi:RNA polymerase sigma-70 factor (ECF subfamily)